MFNIPWTVITETNDKVWKVIDSGRDKTDSHLGRPFPFGSGKTPHNSKRHKVPLIILYIL